MLSTGDLHELLDVFTELRHAGELFIQFGDDGGDVALAVDQTTDQRGAVVELDHAFGVEQHVAFLRGLVLEAIALAPGRCFAAIKAHRVIPLCQTRCSVTL